MPRQPVEKNVSLCQLTLCHKKQRFSFFARKHAVLSFIQTENMFWLVAIIKSSLQDYSHLDEYRLLFLDSVNLLFNNTLLSFHRKLLFRIVYSNDSAQILYHKTQPMHLAKNKKKTIKNDDYR